MHTVSDTLFVLKLYILCITENVEGLKQFYSFCQQICCKGKKIERIKLVFTKKITNMKLFHTRLKKRKNQKYLKRAAYFYRYRL